MASLSSWVFNLHDRTVTMRCSALVHEQNVERLKWVFTHAVAIQAAEAEKRAPHLSRDLGGEVDSSEHPTRGPRPRPDGMLSVFEDVYLPQGSLPPPLTQEHFQAALDVLTEAAVLANVSGTGLTAEFPFFGTVPALGTTLGYRSADGLPETALLQMSIEMHPFLGHGLLAQLALPTGAIDREAAPAYLNVAEATEWTAFHFLGSWCMSPLGLTFLTFIPTAAAAVAPPAFLYETMAVRCQWVRNARHRLQR